MGYRTTLMLGALAAMVACSEADRPDGGSTNPPKDATTQPDAAAPDAAAPDADPEDSRVPDAANPDAAEPDSGVVAMSLSGRVTYDWAEAAEDNGAGETFIDYSTIQARPARRVVVQAIAPANQAVLASAVTDDDGRYTLAMGAVQPAKVRVVAQLLANGQVPDGIGLDRCNGASWDVRVVDNTMGYAQYVMDGATTYQASATAVDLHAALVYNGSYRDRTAAPFNLLDIFVTEVELICQGSPAVQLPILYINWSVNNVPEGDNIETGEIGTSYYDQVNGESNLYICGKAEVDTDEYDDHIIAHETGHYFEDRLYRSDSEGGSHADYEVLDPTVAFGEGFGNAISGMTFNDPVYVDTSGVGQVGGFAFDVSVPATGDDRGVYSETAVESFLWNLYDRRTAPADDGNYDRIHQILRFQQTATEARTTVLSFAAFYNEVFGQDAEGLRELWEGDLDTPYAALCAGACSGTGDTADPYDVDNDIGAHYGNGTPSARHYPEDTGPAYPADFWRLYKDLEDGANLPNAHDQTRFGDYADPDNKLGAIRWYRYQGMGAKTVRISNLGASNCGEDVIDLAVYGQGVELDSNYDLMGCPSVSFTARQSRTYIIVVYGLTTELPSYTVTVGP